jgi:hypothetical protein
MTTRPTMKNVAQSALERVLPQIEAVLREAYPDTDQEEIPD